MIQLPKNTRTPRRVAGLLATLLVFFIASASSIPLSTPLEQQMSASRIQQFLQQLNAQEYSEIHHVVIMRNGYIVAQMHPAPFAPEQAHTQYSVSKTVTALAVGLAADRGLIDIDTPIVNYLPDTIVARGKNRLPEVTLSHLMSMTSGFAKGLSVRTSSDDWLYNFLTLGFTHVPGSFYYYDTMSAYAVAAILERVTGRPMLDLLQQYLFDPLEIHDAEWERCPLGSCTGGWGLRISAESLAKIGQLMLDRGEWNGSRIISREWIDTMITAHTYDPYLNSTSEYGCGYGFFTYRCTRSNAFRAEGNQGQLLVVAPDLKLVVVVQAAAKDAAVPFMRYLWNNLAPACNTPDLNHAQTQQALENYIAQSALPIPEGASWNYPDDSLRIKLRNNAYDIQNISIARHDSAATVYLKTSAGTEILPAGCGTWLETHLQHSKPYYSLSARNRFAGITAPFTAATAYAWQGDTLAITIRYTDWGSAVFLRFDTKTNKAAISSNADLSAETTVLFTIENENERYDIDGNGSVEVADLNILISHLLDPTNPAYSSLNTDINRDKCTDVADVNLLISMILKSF